MNERQAFALAHPLDSADPARCGIERYRTGRLRGDGSLLVVVLAVDR